MGDPVAARAFKRAGDHGPVLGADHEAARLDQQRPAGFGLLQDGVAPKTFAAVPFLVFAAPFIIMRNTLRGARIERRRFEFVMMATIIAGFWSLMSGTFFVMTLRAAGLLV